MLALFGHTGEEPSLRINSRNFTCEHCVSAFVAAAFLCCGTITNPQREYNLEFLIGALQPDPGFRSTADGPWLRA